MIFRKFFIFFVASAIFLFLPKKVLAQVVINEFSSGTTSDWIELYNTGTESAQLSNLRIRDSSTNKKDLSGELSASGFQIVTFSNWLNNNGDVVRLIKVVGESEEVLEEISYGDAGGLCAPTSSGSVGRSQDGGATIVRFLNNTQGISNNSAQEEACPVSTPIPTEEPEEDSTPEPTPPPTPTPTPKPPTPTPTKKPTPKPTPSPTPTPTGEILGEEATPSGQEPTSTPEVLGESTFNFTEILPKALIGIGALFLLIAGGFLLLPKIRRYNRKDGESQTLE